MSLKFAASQSAAVNSHSLDGLINSKYQPTVYSSYIPPSDFSVQTGPTMSTADTLDVEEHVAVTPRRNALSDYLSTVARPTTPGNVPSVR